MDRKILEKLMELDSKKADTYLAKLANEIKNKISKSKDNDEIFKNLELLEEFIYKTPEEAISIINTVIKSKKSNKVKKILGRYPGKDYNDLALKCVELLSKIRYMRTPEVLNLLISLYAEKNERIKSESAKTLERLTRYDLDVLKKIGYSAQRKILDTISKWSKNKKIENIEAIKIIAKELLQSSFEGVSMKDYQTMLFHSGVLQPTDYLKKIRSDTTELILSLYNQSKDIKTKMGLIESLSHISYFPIHGQYGDEVVAMITDDVRYLVGAYHKIIFDKRNKIIASVPIVQEIEKQLNWITQNFKIPKTVELLDKIRKDEFYSLYRLLVGDITTSLKRGESWEKVKEEQEKRLEAEFKKITKANIREWNDKLNSIAEYRDAVEEWKFQGFRSFLFRIAQQKPDLAKIILDDAIFNNRPLKNFIGEFICGFRLGNNVAIWGIYTERIIRSKDTVLLMNIPASLSVVELNNIREEDIGLLSQIINKEKPFGFLEKANKDVMMKLHYSLIRALINVYGKNKKRVETLISSLIRNEKEEWCLQMHIRQLSFALHRNVIDFSEWDKNNIELILNKLVDLRDIDYEAQILLLTVAKKYFSLAMEVFIKRIKKRSEMETEKWLLSSRYDAIPYHFNNDLKEYIGSHEQYPKIVENWIKKMTLKSSTYNIELAQFLQRIDGTAFKDILSQVIKKGSSDSLNKAVSLLWGIDSPDINICLEIIKKTDNREILNRIGGMMFNTGMVSGEYGIAEAHERKAKEIKEYTIEGTKKEKERIEKFKKEIVRDLEKSAKKEKQRTEEDIKLRKMEFEG